MTGRPRSGRARSARPALAGLLLALAAVAVVGSAAARTAEPPRLSLSGATAAVRWDEGWLRPGAAVRFTGDVEAPATLTATLRPLARPGIVTAHAELNVARAGKFTEKLALPPRPLPGVYSLRVGGTSGDARLRPVDVEVTIPAPPEGVSDRALVGPTKNGPWLAYVGQTGPALSGSHKELWTRFRFLYPPTGQKVLLVWKLRWHTVVGKVYKRYRNTIDTFARSGSPLPKGVWSVVLSIDGRVAKRMDVRLTG